MAAENSRIQWTAALALLALFNLWVSQPLLDLLGRYPEFLVAHDLSGMEIVLLAFGVCLFVPGLLLAILQVLKRTSRPAASWIVQALVGLLMFQMAMLFIVKLGQPVGLPALSLAIVMGGAGLALFLRTRLVPQMLAWLSPVAVIFPALFLLKPGVAVLLQSQPEVSTSQAAGQVPVIVMVFDEFSLPAIMTGEGEIDAGLFPNFAGLANSSHWFRNATTVSDWTTLAVPAILTGRYPDEYRPPSASAYPENLFSWLAPHYTMHAFEPGVRICPRDACLPLTGTRAPAMEQRLDSLAADLAVLYRYLVTPEPWAANLPNIAMRWSGFSDEPEDAGLSELRSGLMFSGRLDIFRQFGESAAAAVSPTLHFMHILAPHAPYEYLPGGYRYPGSWEVLATNWDTWEDNPHYVAQARARYRLQVQAMDEVLGGVMQRLRASGAWDRSLIVVTADHGGSFRPGGHWRTAGIGEASMDDILRVPLFIKQPKQDSGEIHDEAVESIDIMPTLAAELEIAVPWPLDGRPLFANPEPLAGPRFFATVRDGAVQAAQWNPGASGAWWPAASDPGASLYRYHGFVAPLGRPVGEFEQGPASAWRADLARADDYLDIDPGHPLRPSLVSARLTGGDTPPELVAIAVNDVVHEVTRTVADHGDQKLLGLVPPEAFRQGLNTVRLFEAEHDGASWRLSEIAMTGQQAGPAWSLREEGLFLGDSGLVDAAGDDSMRGEFTTFFRSGETLEFAGWAVDVTRERSAQAILLFEDGRLVDSAEPDKPAPGVGAALGLEDVFVLRAFEFMVPVSDIERPDEPCLRLFAVSGDGRYIEIGTRQGAWNSGCENPGHRD